ncbi:MAG: NADH-quinone oxidoreductase subunit N [bacterium]
MPVSIEAIHIWAIFTPLLLGLLLLGGLLLEMTVWKERPRAVGIYTLVGLIAVFIAQAWLHILRLNISTKPFVVFQEQYFFDLFSVLFNYVFLLGAGVAVLLSLTHFQDDEDHRGEYYLLILVATIGMCVMAAAHDLLILFIGIEIMSIAVYALVGIQQRRLISGEASVKYLLLGAFSSAILVYGMALIFGVTGELTYQALSAEIDAARTGDLLSHMTVVIGIFLFLVGLLFKVAAVPFHMWTPDVYEGAPTPITAFMATAVKAAAFAALVRVGITAFRPLWWFDFLYYSLWVIAVLTMTLGNFVAIAQKNLKRMLAYSSIAHAGYLLVGVTAIVAVGPIRDFFGDDKMMNIVKANTTSVIFYVLVYTLMNLGAFGVIVALCREKEGGETLSDFAGLARKRPGMAAAMAVFMFSLTGIPPLAGFAGKFFIFQSAIKSQLYVLAVIGMLNSVVSAYYYLRVVVVMYMTDEEKPFVRAPSMSGAVLVNAVMSIVVVLLGVFPQRVMDILIKFFEKGMFDVTIK